MILELTDADKKILKKNRVWIKYGKLQKTIIEIVSSDQGKKLYNNKYFSVDDLLHVMGSFGSRAISACKNKINLAISDNAIKGYENKWFTIEELCNAIKHLSTERSNLLLSDNAVKSYENQILHYKRTQ
ncbi:MAG: hypothetical protein RCG15_03915 [Candidatus Rickettsia vulgarisii]